MKILRTFHIPDFIKIRNFTVLLVTVKWISWLALTNMTITIEFKIALGLLKSLKSNRPICIYQVITSWDLWHFMWHSALLCISKAIRSWNEIKKSKSWLIHVLIHLLTSPFFTPPNGNLNLGYHLLILKTPWPWSQKRIQLTNLSLNWVFA